VRVFAVFIAVCILLLAVLAWYAFAPQPHAPVPVPAYVPPPPAQPPQPAPQTQPAESSPEIIAQPPTTQPIVNWATDPDLLDAQHRLERAQQVLRDDPTHEPALRDKAAALADLRQWSPLADTLGRLIELHPDDARLRYERATVLMQLRQWLDAVAELKLVVASQPEDSRAWFNLAAAQQELGRLADARQAWDRAIELAPTAEARARRGEVLLDLGEWTAATADFEAILAEQPGAPDAALNLALALVKLGRAAEARSRLLEALADHPRNVLILNRLAELAAARCAADSRSDCDEAVRWCRQSLAIDPQQPAVQDLLAQAQDPMKR
jgi:tetratricopeptide (TPR) repeat protein